MYGKEKKAIVADFIVPPLVWVNLAPNLINKNPKGYISHEWDTNRKALGQKRIAILKKYADSYNLKDDTKTDLIMKESMELQKNVDGLIVKYYDKIKKSVWRCLHKTQ